MATRRYKFSLQVLNCCIPDWPTCKMSACFCAKVKLMKGTSHQEDKQT